MVIDKKTIQTRYGKKIIITLSLSVGKKVYRVKKTDYDYGAGVSRSSSYYKLNRTQLKSILTKATKPGDWMIRRDWHFDGMIDGTRYDDQDFQVADQAYIDWLVKEITEIKGYYSTYEPDLDEFTICHPALDHYTLLPRRLQLTVSIQ